MFVSGKVKVGNTNYTIYCSGYPLWAPYSTSMAEGLYKYYQCLLFSENVTLLTDNIYLSGVDNKSIYYPYLPEIQVGEKNFRKLVNFIQSKGFVVPQRGIPCDYQYTFFDTNGNRHALITIKRDKDGNPSMQGTVDHINVWAYYNGIKDQDHFFMYDIYKEKVVTIPTFKYKALHIQSIKKGYEDFLAFVNKSDK